MERFKEGWVQLQRPFLFGDLDHPLQKFSILYCYHFDFTYKETVSEKGLKEIDSLYRNNSKSHFFKLSEDELEREANRLSEIHSVKKVSGQKIYTYIGENECRFYPNEYKILSLEKVKRLIEEPGFHAVPTVRDAFKDANLIEQIMYLRSRGLSEHDAKRMCSLSLKDKVYFKPYFHLLELFARNYEIFVDPFYEEVENIKLTKEDGKIYAASV